MVAGLLAFVVPFPHHQDRSVKIGETEIGLRTEDSEKLPPAVGVVLVAGGVIALVVGMSKG